MFYTWINCSRKWVCSVSKRIVIRPGRYQKWTRDQLLQVRSKAERFKDAVAVDEVDRLIKMIDRSRDDFMYCVLPKVAHPYI